jgi:hypothetical protein
VDAGEEPTRALSFLTPEQATRLGGLPAEAVVGVFLGDAVNVQQFQPNRVFVDFMHDVIRRRGPEDPSLRAAAAEQGEGWLYVIDQRTPEGPQGRVPPEDIIGGFKVEHGHVVAECYWANEHHRVFTHNGIVRLPPSLHEALLRELERRKGRVRDDG